MQSTNFQWSAGAIENANESSSVVPTCHSTNPLGMDLEAEPDPRRARRESYGSVRFNPAALLPANANAANAEAEEAIPAPAGKIFFVINSARSLKFCLTRIKTKV